MTDAGDTAAVKLLTEILGSDAAGEAGILERTAPGAVVILACRLTRQRGTRRNENMSMRRGAVVTVTALLIAAMASCEPVNTPSPETVVGEWERPTETLPPINLVFTPDASELRARLRLSGVERHGRATITGTTLRIAFDDGGVLDGRFTSSTQLILTFGSSGRTYTLQKRP